MTQVFFDHELEESLANQHGGKSTKPLTLWNLKPVQIGDQQYYLYREKTSGMLVLSDNLDLQTFGYVVKRLIQKMGFLTAEQREKLSQKMANYYSQHRFVEQIDDEALQKAKKVVADHQNELIAELEGSPELAHNTILCRASQKLMYFLGNNDQVNEIISRVMNELYPVKINKPKSTVKYHTIQAKFEDPRKWADLVGEQPADHVTELSAIKANNRVMIKQFLTSKFGEQLVEKDATEKLLDNYLNDFLLSSERIGLVTDNLADVNRYFWKILNSDGDDDLAVVVLTDFYKFLSQTAIINKPNIAKVRGFLQDALDIFNGKADKFNEASEADLTKFIHNDSAFVDEFRDQMGAMIGQGELPAGLAKYLYPLKKVPKGADGSEQSYTIKVQLAEFEPTMSRTFSIGSWETMAELQKLIIKMFHGRLEHLYDLTDDVTGECYLLPMFKDYYEMDNPLVDAEKATVACLNVGDRLTLHYDYGAGWEFKLRVQSIAELGGHAPWISSARGYGIIEDIGGVDALEDYYHDFRAGYVDPAIKEWLGGQLINLDFVSVQQLNAEINR